MKFFLLAIGAFLTLSANSLAQTNPVDELEAIEVNGSKQWLLQRGADQSKPVVLFVHGGPGSPLMHFSRAFDKAFIQDFIVVHWDQRGSGKSFDPNEPSANYTFQNFVDDGLVVANHLKKKFQKEKIFLVAHSWGTMVAFNMVAKQPALFQSLVTVGTVSDMGQMENFRYQRVLSGIEESHAEEAKTRIKELGPPPYLNFDSLTNFGDLLVEIVGFSGTFHNLSIDQLNEAVSQNKEYSEVELVASMEGMRSVFNSLSSYLFKYDALKAVPKILVPTYFVQGKYDFNTPTILARDYFDELNAPKGKHWVEFENSAHFPFYEEPGKFLEVLKRAAAD